MDDPPGVVRTPQHKGRQGQDRQTEYPDTGAGQHLEPAPIIEHREEKHDRQHEPYLVVGQRRYREQRPQHKKQQAAGAEVGAFHRYTRANRLATSLPRSQLSQPAAPPTTMRRTKRIAIIKTAQVTSMFSVSAPSCTILR